MARCEVRHVARVARVAWLPRGPVIDTSAIGAPAFDQLLSRLRDEGFLLCIDDPYRHRAAAAAGGTALAPVPRTAIVDLAIGREQVWSAIDSQWRYGVRSAGRAGVVIEQTRDEGDVETFFALCEQISQRKGFELPGSRELLRALVCAPATGAVEARLFVARLGAALAAGALVLRSGRSLHYFWGGVDRRFPKQRAGEAVQWGVMDWALENGIERYDLEGIDPERNPGTYRFKIKMGGRPVELPGKRAYPLGAAGRVALSVGRWMGKL
jgi:lipid II:glycine glycyltransferase (peptidoglycan interpeptide bridge formation enzyme)